MARSVPDRPVSIVFLDGDSLPPGVGLRPPGFPHELIVFPHTPVDLVGERIADAEIVVTNKVPVDGRAVGMASRLRLVAVAATGTDMVDLAACAGRGIVVSNVRDYATTSVPEHVFALVFALRRNIVAYRESVRRGRWQEAGRFCYFDYPIRDLAGATLGIVGAGALGQAVARLGAGLGMNVAFAARKDAATAEPGRMPFVELLAVSDVISLHLPLTPSTRNLIGPAEFGQMARRPLLINTARGGLVDEAALCEALRAGRIAGAGFDVASEEPMPADHPFNALLDRPDFILTPHVAWASRASAQRLADQVVENIEAFRSGAPRNVVAA